MAKWNRASAEIHKDCDRSPTAACVMRYDALVANMKGNHFRACQLYRELAHETLGERESTLLEESCQLVR